MLDVDDARFLPPGAGDDTMNARIGAWLRERGHAAAAGDGALIRLVLDGLAAAYARSVRALDAGGGRPLEAVHVIGGGAQNRLLCQLTADACRLPVVAGPVEATALGNVLAQAYGLGLVRGAAEARAIVGASVELTTYLPEARGEAHGRALGGGAGARREARGARGEARGVQCMRRVRVHAPSYPASGEQPVRAALDLRSGTTTNATQHRIDEGCPRASRPAPARLAPRASRPAPPIDPRLR